MSLVSSNQHLSGSKNQYQGSDDNGEYIQYSFEDADRNLVKMKEEAVQEIEKNSLKIDNGLGFSLNANNLEQRAFQSSSQNMIVEEEQINDHNQNVLTPQPIHRGHDHTHCHTHNNEIIREYKLRTSQQIKANQLSNSESQGKQSGSFQSDNKIETENKGQNVYHAQEIVSIQKSNKHQIRINQVQERKQFQNYNTVDRQHAPQIIRQNQPVSPPHQHLRTSGQLRSDGRSKIPVLNFQPPRPSFSLQSSKQLLPNPLTFKPVVHRNSAQIPISPKNTPQIHSPPPVPVKPQSSIINYSPNIRHHNSPKNFLRETIGSPTGLIHQNRHFQAIRNQHHHHHNFTSQQRPIRINSPIAHTNTNNFYQQTPNIARSSLIDFNQPQINRVESNKRLSNDHSQKSISRHSGSLQKSVRPAVYFTYSNNQSQISQNIEASYQNNAIPQKFVMPGVRVVVQEDRIIRNEDIRHENVYQQNQQQNIGHQISHQNSKHQQMRLQDSRNHQQDRSKHQEAIISGQNSQNNQKIPHNEPEYLNPSHQEQQQMPSIDKFEQTLNKFYNYTKSSSSQQITHIYQQFTNIYKTIKLQINSNYNMAAHKNVSSKDQKQYQDIINKLRKQQVEMDAKIGRYSEQYVKLDRQYHELEHQFTIFKKQCNAHKSKFDQHRQSLENRLGQYQQEIHQLKSQIQAAKKINVNIPQSQDKIKLQNHINSLSQHIQSLQVQINEKQNKFNEINGKLSQEIDEITQRYRMQTQEYQQYRIEQQKKFEHEILGREEIINLLREENSNNCKQQKYLEEYVKQLQEKLAEKPIQKSQNQTNNSQLSDLKQYNKKLEQQIKKLQHTNTTLQAENHIYQQKSKRYDQDLQKLQQEHNKYQEATQHKLQQKLDIIQKQLKNNKQKSFTDFQSPSKISNRSHLELSTHEELERENQKLKVELRGKQQQRRKLEDQIINIKEANRKKIMEKESQIRMLNDQHSILADQLTRKIKDKQRKIGNLQEQIQQLRTSLRKSNSQTNKLSQFQPINKNQATITLNQLSQLKNKLSSLQQQNNNLLSNNQQLQKKPIALQSTIQSLEEQISKIRQQLMTNKRQLASLSTLQEQNKIINETLTKKNNQIMKLKSISLEYGEIKMEVDANKKERNNLKEIIKNKNKEIEELQNVVYQLQLERNSARDVLNRSQKQVFLHSNLNLKSADDEEIQLINQTIRRKDTEIGKLKQTNQLQITNIEQLQYEAEKMKNKVSFAERTLAHQKQEADSKIQYLENRIKQLESKGKNLQESNRQTKDKYEQEIQALDLNVKEKEDTIRKLQGQVKVHRIKLKGHDSKVQQYQSEFQSLHYKIKQLENQKMQLKKQLGGLEESGKLDKNKLYDQYQIKIADLETKCTISDKKIKHLENTVETLKLRLHENSKNNQADQNQDFIRQQQVEVMRKKIAQYESRAYNQGNKFLKDFKPRDYESAYVFQQKVIYDLKSQNQRLKLLLSDKSARPIQIKPTKQVSSDSYNYIQKRLHDFNHRLQQMIILNKQLQQQNPDTQIFHNRDKISLNFQQQIQNRKWSRQKQQILERHRQQIDQIQKWMTELHRYCASLENIDGRHTQSNFRQKIIINDKDLVNQQISYLKTKNKELEGVIDQNIKINKDLKEKLEQYLKNDPKNIMFYKDQNEKLQKRVIQLEKILKQERENNRLLQRQLDKIKNDETDEIRILELENIIHELNRKLAQADMQKQILEADLMKIRMQLERQNSEVLRLQELESQKNRKISQLSKNHDKQLIQWKQSSEKYRGRVQLLEAEIDRLREYHQSDKTQSHSELNKYITRITHLESQIANRDKSIHSLQQQVQQLSQQNLQTKNRLQNKMNQLANLQILFDNQQQKFNNYEKKIDQLEELCNQLRTQMYQAINEKDSIKVLYDQLYAKYNQLNDSYQGKCVEYQKIYELLEKLKDQREREGDQSKKKLDYIYEMENIIEKLKKELSYYQEAHHNANQQINKLQDEISRLQGEIERLRSIIMQIQEQIQGHEGLKSNLTYNVQYSRSILIMLETLLGELKIQSDMSQIRIRSQILDGIEKGLNNCSEAMRLF